MSETPFTDLAAAVQGGGDIAEGVSDLFAAVVPLTAEELDRVVMAVVTMRRASMGQSVLPSKRPTSG